MRITYIIITFFLSFPLYSQLTLTLQPGPAEGIDAKIQELLPFENFGDDPEYIAATWTNSESQTGSIRSLLFFDLSQLPLNAEIVQAQLSLYYNYISLSPGQIGHNAAYLRRIRQPWEEHDVSWSTQPNYWTTNEVYLPESTVGNQDYDKINVTALICDMIVDPAHSYGFILMLADESPNSSMKFFSSDGTVPLKRPKLEITYNLPSVLNDISLQPLNIFPNPANESVELKGLDGTFKIVATSATGVEFDLGQKVITAGSYNLEFPGSMLPGLYLLKAIGEKTVYTAKLLKL